MTLTPEIADRNSSHEEEILRLHDALEDLAKLALSKMKADAPVDDVVRVKQRARALAGAVRGGACDRVEANLKSWRAELR